LQLLEFEQKKRATASVALSNAYFTPLDPRIFSDMNSKKDNSGSFSPSLGSNSPRNPKLNESYIKGFGSTAQPSSNSTVKDQYAQKDSLYLDMGG